MLAGVPLKKKRLERLLTLSSGNYKKREDLSYLKTRSLMIRIANKNTKRLKWIDEWL